MVEKVNDNWDLDGNGIGAVTYILLVDTDETTVEVAVKALQERHIVVGIDGAYLAVQGSETPVVADVSVVATFAHAA